MLACAGFLVGCATQQSGPARGNNTFPEVGIRGDWLTVGGEKFLVVGVGYEYYSRPGQAPWKKKSEPDVMREDFRRIREAGFNTIRTWGPLSDEELDLAAEYGLWVIQGLWIKPDADFNDPDFQRETLDFYRREVTRSARHPNILFYLLLNEPHGNAVYRAGPEKMNAFYAEMVRVAKECDPKRYFSYSNCVHTDFMVPTMWDLTAQNVYPYAPTTIDRCLRYRGYLEWVKRTLAKDKPLIITEHGLSVSPNGDGRGYGGNTLAEQRDGMIRMNEDWLAAGASGGCAFMWTDGWWKTGSEDQHNPGPESWYGLLEVDSSYLGQPRPVYYALKEYNKSICTLPRDGQNVTEVFEVEVWAPGASKVQYRVDDGAWTDIERHGDWWWRGHASLVDAVDGGHYLRTRSLDASGRAEGEKTLIVRLSNLTKAGPGPYSIRFVDLPASQSKDAEQRVTVELRDVKGLPVRGARVRIDRFLNTGWNETGQDLETDNKGLAAATFPALHEAGIVSISAAAVYEEGLIRRVVGDYRHVELVKE